MRIVTQDFCQGQCSTNKDILTMRVACRSCCARRLSFPAARLMAYPAGMGHLAAPWIPQRASSAQFAWTSCTCQWLWSAATSFVLVAQSPQLWATMGRMETSRACWPVVLWAAQMCLAPSAGPLSMAAAARGFSSTQNGKPCHSVDNH